MEPPPPPKLMPRQVNFGSVSVSTPLAEGHQALAVCQFEIPTIDANTKPQATTHYEPSTQDHHQRQGYPHGHQTEITTHQALWNCFRSEP